MKQTILTLAAVLALAGSARASGGAEPVTADIIQVDPNTLPVNTDMAMTIVPEPSTLAVYALGAISLLFRNRRPAKA